MLCGIPDHNPTCVGVVDRGLLLAQRSLVSLTSLEAGNTGREDGLVVGVEKDMDK